MFAGSGCVGVAVLKHIEEARVDFAEKEKRFLGQIEINAKLNAVDKNHYRVLESDIFSGVRETYDYILANPPYVAETRKEQVQESVFKQEPYDAVFGGKDGLLYIQKFLKGVKARLREGGVVYMEFDSHQKDQVYDMAKQFGAVHIEICKDQYNKWRYARIVF
jgi:HemK-like putative methylase